MNISDSSVLRTSTCDDCGRKGPGTEFFSHGEPVYFVCRTCEPKPYERKAQDDIDRWLKGEDL